MAKHGREGRYYDEVITPSLGGCGPSYRPSGSTWRTSIHRRGSPQSFATLTQRLAWAPAASVSTTSNGSSMVISNTEAKSAAERFADLGNKYLSCRMPLWLRRHLGGGLLTALNKEAPLVEGISDARPVKAEDSDTSSWCKALGRGLATSCATTIWNRSIWRR